MNLTKYVHLVFVSTALVLTFGCATDNQAGEDPLNGTNRDEQLEPFDSPTNPTVDNDDISSKLGYVRYSKEEMELEQDENRVVTFNREEMANTITRLILRNNEFEEVATLVTDDEILIAYDKPQEMDREEAATIVRKTALSIVPRFFHVYVSDQATSFQDIQSLQNSTSLNDDYQTTLEKIIEEMKDTPQGENIYDDAPQNIEHQD